MEASAAIDVTRNPARLHRTFNTGQTMGVRGPAKWKRLTFELWRNGGKRIERSKGGQLCDLCRLTDQRRPAGHEVQEHCSQGEL